MGHTPAPWKIRYLREENPESGFFVEAENNNKPELGYGIEIMMEDFGDHNGYPFEQRLADAKLIAAAPELLEALIKIRDMIYDSGEKGLYPEYLLKYHAGTGIRFITEAIEKATH